MVFCSRCGAQNVDYANYCHNCGARIVRDETELFEKRINEFAEEVGRFAEEFGKKAEAVAKKIHAEIMEDDEKPPQSEKPEGPPEKLKKAGEGEPKGRPKKKLKKVEKTTKPEQEIEFCMYCGSKLTGKPDTCSSCGKKIDY
jgi:predicted amidophosphoribosyltransferase